MIRNTAVLVVLALTALAIACTGENTPAPTATATLTATAAPTAAATPTATATPTPEAAKTTTFRGTGPSKGLHGSIEPGSYRCEVSWSENAGQAFTIEIDTGGAHTESDVAWGPEGSYAFIMRPNSSSGTATETLRAENRERVWITVLAADSVRWSMTCR